MKDKITKFSHWRKVTLVLFAVALTGLITLGSGRRDEAVEWRDLMCPVVPTEICWIDFYGENPDGSLYIIESIPFPGWKDSHVNVLPEVIIDPEE